MSGYKDWIDSIEIKIDYFSAFMKAWIAFNAWYNNSGEVSGKNDKERIEFIGSKQNRFRTYMENLLISDSTEGSLFRGNLASLHSALLSAAITTQEYIGVCNTISFSEVAMKNNNVNERLEFRNIKYECSRAHGKITTIVTNIINQTELLRYEQDEYNLDNLQQQSDYMRLTPQRQSKCVECYKKLVPYISTSVLATNEDDNQKHKC